MAVKNLARAIIQGGRTNYNKWQRRYSTRVERRQVKRYVAKMISEYDGEILHPRLDFELGVIVMETESVGGNLVEPVREHISPEFDDHLGTLESWLDAHVGKDWEEVWHKLCRFDRNSIAGRHLVNDHARGQVSLISDHHNGSRDFIVDDEGKFCRASDFKSERSNVLPRYYKELKSDRFANDRKVVDRCGVLYWKDGEIQTAMSDEESEYFHSLTGHTQRKLKGYHRSYRGQRRKDRPLPSEAKYDAQQRALGRKPYI